MAKGSWQLWIPVWNIYYMIREYIREGKKEEEREKEHAALLAEARSATDRVQALKFERAHALLMGNKSRADEIDREIHDLVSKQIDKLLGK